MKLELLSTTNDGAVFFIEGQPEGAKGFIDWSPLIPQGDNVYKTSINGSNIKGVDFGPTEVEIKVDGDINPTKVFWAIYKVVTKTICPDCLNSHP